MGRQSKQNIRLNCAQIIIALFVVFDVVFCAKLPDVHGDTNEDLSRPLASILTNYHSDAEQVQRSVTTTTSNFENKSNEGQTNIKPSRAKYEHQLKIVKRSPPNYNFGLESKRERQYAFGLGKRNSDKVTTAIDEKQAQILESQIRKLLNYLYNLDMNLIWNYLSNTNEEDLQPALATNKITNELLKDDQDDAQSEKYKAKRDTLQRQRQFNFGLGKRERQYAFGLGKRFSTNYDMDSPRLDEYIKRRYSFGIGKRSVE